MTTILGTYLVAACSAFPKCRFPCLPFVIKLLPFYPIFILGPLTSIRYICCYLSHGWQEDFDEVKLLKLYLSRLKTTRAFS